MAAVSAYFVYCAAHRTAVRDDLIHEYNQRNNNDNKTDNDNNDNDENDTATAAAADTDGCIGTPNNGDEEKGLCVDEREKKEAKSSSVKIGVTDVAKELGRRWRALSREEQDVWREKAKQKRDMINAKQLENDNNKENAKGVHEDDTRLGYKRARSEQGSLPLARLKKMIW